ncbi:hypothetical protein LUZ60_014391 [Juncus effusus]|nr:hypothetical protein LUZ60_014391 [Juncus effusus]
MWPALVMRQLLLPSSIFTPLSFSPSIHRSYCVSCLSLPRLPLPLLHIQTDRSSHSLLSPCFSSIQPTCSGGDGNINNNNNGNNNNNNNGGWWWNWEGSGNESWFSPLISTILLLYLLTFVSSAIALDTTFIWEVNKHNREKVRLKPDPSGEDLFIIDKEDLPGGRQGIEFWSNRCRDLIIGLILPHGYPHSVSSDYLEYSLWRAIQGIAAQISGVLSTQALLYAVGLGKGAIPTAAAINWVLKDGIGYLSKIFLSKFGRHFDVNPKGWRLFADLLENAAYGMEIITPIFPQYFVFIGAVAGAGRSAAALIQAATRSCFYAGFAAERNFAEVIAKGEAQGMVSKFIGITLGIALAKYINSSAPLALSSYLIVTAIHMYCNLKSYQSIQLRTLNPYRASLVFSEYLLSGQVPSVKEVNNEEPIFQEFPSLTVSKGHSEILSKEAKDASAEICRRLELGSKLSEITRNKEDAIALFELYKDEGYLLAENQGKFCVVLKENSSTQDMLKSLFHVNYLYWLEKYVVIEPKRISEECLPGGRLHISLDYVKREFSHVKIDGSQSGWDTEALIARPLPNRICIDE